MGGDNSTRTLNEQCFPHFHKPGTNNNHLFDTKKKYLPKHFNLVCLSVPTFRFESCCFIQFIAALSQVIWRLLCYLLLLLVQDVFFI